tara:strand:- start:288 stop:599 length:312 start_codon:yes stop_codon:yes gene_type:complete
LTSLEKILSEEDLKYIDAIEDQFVDYVWSFYGNEEPLYPIVGLTKKDIVDAFKIYVDRILKGDLEYVHYSWGDGDSLDRERVRDIILENPKFEFVNRFTLLGV